LHINIIMRFAVTPTEREVLYTASLPSRGVTSQAIKYANEFSPDHMVLQYKTSGSSHVVSKAKQVYIGKYNYSTLYIA